MEKKRVHYLSLASIVSAFAVVMLHTNGCFWMFSTDRYWMTANIIECVMYFAVPVFFMISGATLIDYRKRYSTKEYLQKRVKKTVIPFVIWSVVGVIFLVARGDMQMPSGAEGMKDVIQKLLNAEIVSVYWFFVPLFGMYLCIPLISAVKEELRKSVFTFLIVAGFVCNSLLPLLCEVFAFKYTNRVTIDVVSGYLIYVLVGYLISTNEIPRRWRLISYVLAIIGLGMHMIGTYVLSMENGGIVSLYKGYTNVPTVLYAIGIFIFIKEVGNRIRNEKLVRVIEGLSGYTFAIYLLHWFVMLQLIETFSIDILSITYRVGMPILIFFISIIIAWIIRKVPVLKHILP